MLLLVVVPSLFAISCGKQLHSGPDELTAYVEEFQAAGASVNRPIQVGQIKLKLVKSLDQYGAAVAGYCDRTKTPPEVLILKARWAGFGEVEREMLIFHELGHCVLGREHLGLVNPVNRLPVSLMFPGMIPAAIYSAARGHYIYELFWNRPALMTLVQ